MTAANHASANGQAERTVQTVMLGLVSYLGALWDPSSWERHLPHVLHVMNTSESATTRQIPFIMLYGRLPRGFLPPTVTTDPDFSQQQQIAREEAAENIQIAQAKMKIYYDDRHKSPPNLKEGDFIYIKLAKPRQRGYHFNHQTKLSFRQAGPYEIRRKISPLRYELILPKWLKWSPQISIEHLVPASHAQATAKPLEPGALNTDGEQKYIVQDIVGHAMRKIPPSTRNTLHYEVKWMNYEGTTWEPHDTLVQDVPRLVKQYRRSHHLSRKPSTSMKIPSTQ